VPVFERRPEMRVQRCRGTLRISLSAAPKQEPVMKKQPTINTRIRFPARLYRQVRHLAVDLGVPVSELIVQAAQALVERRTSEPKTNNP